MGATIHLPDSLYRMGEQLARDKGLTVDELVAEVLEREVAESAVRIPKSGEVTLPLIRSKHPGTLDLSNFNFDDLLT